ncbi:MULTISPECIES: ABC transporter permease [Bradyrhizobium]|uniref:Spermidine/putrescine transport system permease protein n=2 Tax=Bradyrhizobium TaxID=374 RepID=A0ABY0PEC7_9BRAD|nr:MULTISPECIES: ABC transporter permease [Bradyrhizobium]SDI20851.1 putative spermidine/putrescine transport system permease protein [Bradyrhizobium ottawaense]SED73915.1 putative spermidine/putrescine transport system permease protein [Bradyrhizobium lablabi]SHL69621.1 putative spermidine/putrescine transport system permease protein [Bradyrhizobium lablabi]
MANRPSGGWNPELGFASALILSMPLIVLLLLLVVFPISQILMLPLEAGGFRQFASFFQVPANVRALEYTVLISLTVTFGTVILAAPLAWTLRMPGSTVWKSIIWLAVLAPLWMNIVIKTYAFMIILGRHGILSEAAQTLRFTSESVGLLYTPWAVIIAMVHTMLPYGVLPLFVTFATIDSDLVRAAESLGATRAGAISSVIIPLSLVGILATGTIVFVICLGFYVTPVILGGAQTPYISTLVQGDLFLRFDTVGAATDSAVLTAVAGLIVVLASWLLGGQSLKRALG